MLVTWIDRIATCERGSSNIGATCSGTSEWKPRRCTPSSLGVRSSRCTGWPSLRGTQGPWTSGKRFETLSQTCKPSSSEAIHQQADAGLNDSNAAQTVNLLCDDQ